MAEREESIFKGVSREDTMENKSKGLKISRRVRTYPIMDFVRKYSKLLVGIIIKMLTQRILQQQAENRRAERRTIPLELILHRIGEKDYQDLVQWMFECAERLELKLSTKFYARTFLDASIIDPQFITYEHYIPLTLAALARAIKVNEHSEISENLTFQALLRSADIVIPEATQLSLEGKISRSLPASPRYTSPNDYLDVFQQRFPFFTKAKRAIPKIIEIALLQTSACQYKGEQIFFGSVLALIRLQDFRMNQFQKVLLLSLTDCWQKANRVAEMIIQEITLFYNQAQEEPQTQ